MANDDIALTINGTLYEIPMGEYLRICDGEVEAQPVIMQHILQLHKQHFDRLAGEMRSLREQLAAIKGEELQVGKRKSKKG